MSFCWWLCAALLLLGVFHLLIGIRLSNFVLSSRAEIETYFRLGWMSSVVMTAVTIIGQGTLLALLVVGQGNYPGVIVPIVGVASMIFAFFKGADFNRQEFAQAVGRGEAPELWTHTEHVAQSLGVAPPDNFVIAMSGNSYVSDIPILHMSGKTNGRTLVFPEPFLRGMTRAQVASLIAHDLALFDAQSSVLPERFRKLHGRLAIWSLQPELVPWLARLTAEIFECYFSCFRTVELELLRSVQFHADSAGASVRSPRDLAEALVRTVVIRLSFDATVNLACQSSAGLSGLGERASDVGTADFKTYLETASVSSSDAAGLAERVRRLGFSHADLEKFSGPPPPGLAAYDSWIAEEVLEPLDGLFTQSLEAEADFASIYYNDGSTAEGRIEIEALLPFQTWKASAGKRAVAVVSILMFTALFSSIFYYSVYPIIQAAAPVVAIGGVACAIVCWLWAADMAIELSVDGVFNTTWRRKLLFSEIDYYIKNDLALQFCLRSGAPGVVRVPILLRKKIKADVQVSWFCDQAIIASEILRYFHHARALEERENNRWRSL